MNNRPPDSNKNGSSNNPFSSRNAQRLWLVLAVVVLLLFVVIFGTPDPLPKGNTITFNNLAEQIEQGRVSKLTLRGSTDIIVLTHQTIEHRVDTAIGRIEALPTVLSSVTRLRVEQLN